MDQLDRNLDKLRQKVDLRLERYLIAQRQDGIEVDPESSERSIFTMPEVAEPLVIENIEATPSSIEMSDQASKPEWVKELREEGQGQADRARPQASQDWTSANFQPVQVDQLDEAQVEVQPHAPPPAFVELGSIDLPQPHDRETHLTSTAHTLPLAVRPSGFFRRLWVRLRRR